MKPPPRYLPQNINSSPSWRFGDVAYLSLKMISNDDLTTIVPLQVLPSRKNESWKCLGGAERLGCNSMPWKVTLTLPETKIAPENWWLEYYFPFWGRPIGRVYFERCSSIYEQSTSNIGKSTFISDLVNAGHFCSFNSSSTLSEVQQRSHVLGPFIWYPQDNTTSTKKDQVSFP